MKIVVQNECGTQEAIVEVIYVRCDKPLIKLVDGGKVLKVDNNSYSVNALFENISSKTQISLKLNSRNDVYSSL